MRSDARDFTESLAHADGREYVLEDWQLDTIEAVMQDTASSGNHGRRLNRTDQDSDSLYLDGRRPSFSLSSDEHEALQGLGGSGIHVAPGDESYHGMVAHRGVMSEREFECMDWESVQRRACSLLGSTPEEIEDLYGPGRPGPERSLRRAEIDTKLLEIQESGGNMHQLAVVLGWPVEQTPTGDRCRKLSKALARARSLREESDG